MAFNLAPLRPWIALNKAGGIVTGHCNCAGGYNSVRMTNQFNYSLYFVNSLSEVCSHVGTLCFAAVALSNKKKTVATTEEKCSWTNRYKRPVSKFQLIIVYSPLFLNRILFNI